MSEIIIPTKKLNDGLDIPYIGLGTYKLKGYDGVKAIHSAIDHGYRLLDSAYNYENEGTIGEAVRTSSISREELLITSKLPGRYQAYEDALTTIEESLFRAGLDYYDFYLIHWPNPITNKYVEAWEALIEAKKRGYVKSIGVCNFLPEHIHNLHQATGVLPSMNQIELHPNFNQAAQLPIHEDMNIATQSWSPIGRANDVLTNDIITKLASKYTKSAAQIILRWHYQLGAISIPKSASPTRQLENIAIFNFELTSEEVEAINSISRADGRNKDQDPAIYEEF